MKTQIIARKGRQFAVVPLRDYQRLVKDAELLEDIHDYDTAKARAEETFPAVVAQRIIGGENPIRVFREYRGLSQTQLAQKAGIAVACLSELETSKKTASVAALNDIARVLRLELDDLAG